MLVIMMALALLAASSTNVMSEQTDKLMEKSSNQANGRKLLSVTNSTPSGKQACTPKVRDHVKAMYTGVQGGQSWYNATIASVSPTLTYTVNWADGDTRNRKKTASQIRTIQATYQVGDHVKAMYTGVMGGQEWYNATIASVSPTLTYTVNWADGDTRDRTKTASQIHTIQATYQVGDHVKALYIGVMGGQEWFNATIASVNHTVTYTVNWADGDTRDRKKTANQIHCAPAIAHQPQNAAAMTTVRSTTTAGLNHNATANTTDLPKKACTKRCGANACAYCDNRGCCIPDASGASCKKLQPKAVQMCGSQHAKNVKNNTIPSSQHAKNVKNNTIPTFAVGGLAIVAAIIVCACIVRNRCSKAKGDNIPNYTSLPAVVVPDNNNAGDANAAPFVNPNKVAQNLNEAPSSTTGEADTSPATGEADTGPVKNPNKDFA